MKSILLKEEHSTDVKSLDQFLAKVRETNKDVLQENTPCIFLLLKRMPDGTFFSRVQALNVPEEAGKLLADVLAACGRGSFYDELKSNGT